MTVTIASDLIDQILRAAAASPDAEVCGLLFGSPDRIAGAMPCLNVAADRSRWFEIDPATLLAAHKEARTGGPRIVGHYHSHPSGLAMPSPRDAAAATPDGALWLIAASGELAAWRAIAHGTVEGRFDPIALNTI